MEEAGAPRSWYRTHRYQVLALIVAALLIASLVPSLFKGSASPNQVRLNMTIDYFAHNYNGTVGLIPEFPGGNTYWLYSDNYLVILAVARYDPGNQSTSGFARALEAAFGGYSATLPPAFAQNQYRALNSSLAYFDCSTDRTLSWTGAGGSEAGPAVLKTTSNDGDPSCASQNYADLLLLRALYQHKVDNAGGALSLYRNATADFDGYGLADLPYTSASSGSYQVYQTYKLAIYVYATYCLAEQASSPGLGAATRTLLSLQSNSTGGFATGYTRDPAGGSGITPNGGANTETTALAALALELMINPSNAC